jgi:hypothetical protein
MSTAAFTHGRSGRSSRSATPCGARDTAKRRRRTDWMAWEIGLVVVLALSGKGWKRVQAALVS